MHTLFLGRPAGLAGFAIAMLACSMGAAQAADTVAPATTLDTVTVFGSRVQSRSVFDSAVPIDVFGPAQVQQALSSGELGQALQSLAPSINMPRASASGTSDSVRAIQFRGLAPDETLVLVNGKRRHSNAVMDFEGLFPGTVAVDLNTLPPGAIDHIEILRDGAGAVYGSDAVAGVVNVVLKSGAGGGSLEVGLGENRSHFAPLGTTITDGQNRSLSVNEGLSVGAGGFVRFGADYQKRDATNRAGRTDARFASFNSTPADLALDQQVVFRSGDPDLENKSLFYNLSWPLAGGTELYSFSTFNKRNTTGTQFFRYPGDPTNVPEIYPMGYRPLSTGDSRDFGLVGGARGRFASWNWDASVREGYDSYLFGLIHTINASLGAASPTSFHIADFSSEQRAVNLDLTGQLTAAALAAPVNVAIGLEFMDERYHTSPGDPASYAQGSYVTPGGAHAPPAAQGDSGLRPQDAVHLSRYVSSLYVDLDHEIASHLLLGAAARYSQYSDYGSSTTGKLSLRYKFTNDLLVRASVSSSFRAPALAQTGIRFATLNFTADGKALQNNAWLPPSDPLAQQFGAVPLGPERSVNASLGLAWRVAPRSSMTADVYQIRLRDRITPTGSLQSTMVSTYLANHGITDIASVTFLTNALDTTSRGLDLVLSHELDLFGGALRLSAAFNRNYLHEDGLRNSSAALALIDPSLTLANPTVLVPLEYGSPGTKLILTADWSSERWGGRIAATRYGRMAAFSFDSNTTPLNGFPGSFVQIYQPAWGVDLEGHYNVGRTFTVTIGGTDVFNRYPDQTAAGSNYGGTFPYNFANPLGSNGAYYYARLTLRFGA